MSPIRPPRVALAPVSLECVKTQVVPVEGTRYTLAIGRVVADPLLKLLAPSAAFVVVGVLLLLVDILFVPADRWTVEAGR